jgi:hypothetical protein
VSGSEIKHCVACSNKARAIVKKDSDITREELKKLIRTLPFTQIGKIYSVSDNAVRKWCDYYNLPRKVSDIKQYTDEEWDKI